MYKKNGWKEYDNSDSMIFMNKGTIKESYLLEDSIDSINKAFVDDFKKYINENPKGYNKEVKP